MKPALVRFAPSGLVLVIALIAFAIGHASGATLVVTTSETPCVTGSSTFSTISAAVAAASDGDTIEVCDGTYSEAFTIGLANLLIESFHPQAATIQAPSELTSGQAIVEVSPAPADPPAAHPAVASSGGGGVTGVTIQQFNVSGPGPGECNMRAAILVHGGGSATITKNAISDTADNPPSGCQLGFGIEVGETGDPGTATITSNTISNFQKAGIYVAGQGSSATISKNVIKGAGKIGLVTQNGIEITDTNLVSAISGNNLSANLHDNKGFKKCKKGTTGPDCQTTATGILEYFAGKKGDQTKLLHANHFSGNETDVVVILPPPVPPLVGSCSPSSSLAVLIKGKNVTSYVPKGNWESSSTGVSLVQLEGSGTSPVVIPTASAVNSCGSDSKTGQTVCVANSSSVFVLSGSSVSQTLTSAASGTIDFSGGTCSNCGVAIDSVDDKALISMATGGSAGFQFLDLGTSPKFEPAFVSPANQVSEDPLVDPIHHLILSPTERSDYEVINIAAASPAFFENTTTTESTFDSGAEDCSTRIALASAEGTGDVYLADLSKATFTPGTPSGTWSAPSQLQNVPEFESFSAGTNGIAVAQGTHTGVVTGEFGGNLFGAILLPATSGSGTPALADWVACNVPSPSGGVPWQEGDDPHTVTAYQSPNSGHAIAVMANGSGEPPTFLAVVDLTKMLNQSIVPRNSGTHSCQTGTNLQTLGVVSFVPVP
ncbi:MAG TPA: right-handed parallel beta-helix repeat-containing protein [Candidatus Binataceae bacterium]|nr:right-handed parallel beta-helix repeat-containing protein [Candidatus Binataceae bacterium]